MDIVRMEVPDAVTTI